MSAVSSLIGTPSPSWSRARAWWIGTSQAEDGWQDFLTARAEVVEHIAALCAQADADPDKVFINGRYLRGFTPRDPQRPAPWLRPLFDESPGMFIPNRRLPEGLAFSQEMVRRIPGPVILDPLDFIGGVRAAAGTGIPVAVRAADGQVPVLLVDADDTSGIRVDEDVWQRRSYAELEDALSGVPR